MERASKWSLTDKEKERFITTLTPHLAILRTKAEISQEEIANLIGVSRQTYSSIERKIRKMSWSTYLSLVLFYDHNQKTHQLMRQLSLFPTELVIRFNEGTDIVEHLDKQAQQKIRQVIMQEYARCTKSQGDAVIKSFDGTYRIFNDVTTRDIQALNAIKAIIADSEKDD